MIGEVFHDGDRFFQKSFQYPLSEGCFLHFFIQIQSFHHNFLMSRGSTYDNLIPHESKELRIITSKFV